MKVSRCSTLLLIKELPIAAEIVTRPTQKDVLLGTTTEFNCTTTGGSPRWLIDGVELDLHLGSPHHRRGITRSYWGQRGTRFLSRLRVSGTDSTNNNTEVQCVVLDVQSEPVLFRIQGNHLMIILICSYEN